jgi:hypothetical protein
MKKVVIVLLGVFISAISSADEYKGFIRSLGAGQYYDSNCNVDSCVVIMVDDSHTGPSCHNASWDYIIDTTTTTGKNTYSLLLAAYSSGKEVVIGGSGNCNLHVGGKIESVDYVYNKF